MISQQRLKNQSSTFLEGLWIIVNNDFSAKYELKNLRYEKLQHCACVKVKLQVNSGFRHDTFPQLPHVTTSARRISFRFVEVQPKSVIVTSIWREIQI